MTNVIAGLPVVEILDQEDRNRWEKVFSFIDSLRYLGTQR